MCAKVAWKCLIKAFVLTVAEVNRIKDNEDKTFNINFSNNDVAKKNQTNKTT